MRAREGVRGPCSEDSSPASYDRVGTSALSWDLSTALSLVPLFSELRTPTSALQKDPWKPPLSLREVSGHQFHHC